MNPDRALMPDYLRLIALFGIVVVNVQFFAFSISISDETAPAVSIADQITKFLVEGLATLKSYGLFSFMFGVGLGFLMASAERRSIDFGPLYRRRMIGLLILGFLHGTLFFYGDILFIYGLMGSLLYLMRNWSVRRLTRMGTILLVASVGIGSLLMLGEGGIPKEFLDLEAVVMTEGSFFDVFLFRSVSFAIVVFLLIFIQGIAALGWFCLGLAAVKAGIIDQPDHPIWAKARSIALIPSVALSLIGAGMTVWGDMTVGQFIVAAAAPLATLGYLGLIAQLSRHPGPITQKLLAVGGSSLSIYLGQSILLSLIFAPYGLGLWEQVGLATAELIAVSVTIALIMALSLWRLKFRLGPFEWVLRRFTYGRAQKNGAS